MTWIFLCEIYTLFTFYTVYQIYNTYNIKNNMYGINLIYTALHLEKKIYILLICKNA